jgi:hypothetical protein
MKDIRPRRRGIRTTYSLSAWDRHNPGCGIGFDCDVDGCVLDPLALSDAAIRNLCSMLFQPDRYTPALEARKHSYMMAGGGRCTCGLYVHLDDATTNGCRCGRFYNGYGQELAHPSQWGEETGERFDGFGREIL